MLVAARKAINYENDFIVKVPQVELVWLLLEVGISITVPSINFPECPGIVVKSFPR